MELSFLLAQRGNNMGMIIGFSVLGLIVLLILFAIFARFISLWIQCKMTGAGISFVTLIMMTI